MNSFTDRMNRLLDVLKPFQKFEETQGQCEKCFVTPCILPEKSVTRVSNKWSVECILFYNITEQPQLSTLLGCGHEGPGPRDDRFRDIQRGFRFS